MQFRPSVEAVDLAIKSQGWYGWLLKSRIDGESRNKVNIDRILARRNIALKLTKLFLCIADALRRRGESEMCLLHFGVVDTEFRGSVKDKILDALKLSDNKESEIFVGKIAGELLNWVNDGHRPDLFKIDKPNLLILARSR